MKQTPFHNDTDYTAKIDMDPQQATVDAVRRNTKTIHTEIVAEYIGSRRQNTVLQAIPPEICNSEETLSRSTRRLLAQLRGGKSPFL
jgi:hypothetical protein